MRNFKTMLLFGFILITNLFLVNQNVFAQDICSWEGVWETGWGNMTLKQQGSTVTGNYPHDSGKINAIISGDTLKGGWSEAPTYSPTSDAGEIKFKMSPDCKSFKGDWRYGFSEHNNSWNKEGWNGKRISAIKSETNTNNQVIVNIWNSAGCNYTDTSSFKLNKPINIEKLQVWYNWQPGENSVSYGLYRNNNLIFSGSFDKGTCDPYQKSWCTGVSYLKGILEPDNYYIKSANSRMCQNIDSNGNGFVVVYASKSSNTFSKSNHKGNSLNDKTSSTSSICSWEGIWESGWGNVTLKQQGSTVTGNYPHDSGKINAIISGDTLEGSWSEAPTYSPTNDAGEIKFKMSPDCKSFKGDWRYGFSEHNNSWKKEGWNGTKK